MMINKEQLASIIDPVAWEDMRPIPDVYEGLPDAEAKQALYEKFFWQGVEQRRKPSLDAADRVKDFLDAQKRLWEE